MEQEGSKGPTVSSTYIASVQTPDDSAVSRRGGVDSLMYDYKKKFTLEEVKEILENAERERVAAKREAQRLGY